MRLFIPCVVVVISACADVQVRRSPVRDDGVPEEERDHGECEERAINADGGVVRVIEYDRDEHGKRMAERLFLNGVLAGSFRYQYDDRGRLTSRAQPDGSGLLHRYAGDTTRLALTLEVPSDREAPPLSTWRYSYDDAGRRTRTWQVKDGAIVIDKRYRYDASGRLAQVVFDDGVVAVHRYDAGRTLIGVDEIEGGVVKRSFTMRYDAKGRRVAQESAGARVEYRYECLRAP